MTDSVGKSMETNLVENERIEKIITSVADKGIYIEESFLSKNLIPVITTWFDDLTLNGEFKKAKIGSSSETSLNTLVRNDEIYWINEYPDYLIDLKNFITKLMFEINSNLFLNLKRGEFHLSQYPKGHFYTKHLDQSKLTKSRLITFLLYLNPEWANDDQGELIVYDPTDTDKQLLKVTPTWGKLVIFRSDQFFHEVRPTVKIRRALSGWYRND